MKQDHCLWWYLLFCGRTILAVFNFHLSFEILTRNFHDFFSFFSFFVSRYNSDFEVKQMCNVTWIFSLLTSYIYTINGCYYVFQLFHGQTSDAKWFSLYLNWKFNSKICYNMRLSVSHSFEKSIKKIKKNQNKKRAKHPKTYFQLTPKNCYVHMWTKYFDILFQNRNWFSNNFECDAALNVPCMEKDSE